MSKILLIDDDVELCNLYKELLTEDGYSVEVAVDGQEALASISTGGYDLIILDIMMPKIDGLEVLRRLKTLNPVPKNGPIVMLSALDQPAVVAEAKALGAKGFLHKPNLTPDQFLAEVKGYLNPQ